ncbi:MAG: DUF547 domain-containing protein, partial [Planctomycetota bacterium]
TLPACADPEPPLADRATAQPLPMPATAPTTAPATQSNLHPALAGYDALLRAHVDPHGYVDYAALAKNPTPLDAYIAYLANHTKTFGDPSLSDDHKLATLINAYNAFTLRLILDHYNGGQLQSIMDIAAGKPWDLRRWNLLGQTITLNQLEHEIIRKQFNEPRIHWAVNCAALSCPPLRNSAYLADQLDQQLAEQEAYVFNFTHPRFAQRSGNGAAVTKLLDWYATDWPDAQAHARTRLGLPATAPITFLDYDWRLNSIQNRPH